MDLCGPQKRKVWLWLAVKRCSRRIVARVLGERSTATARRLWQALSRRYQRRGRYFTDRWESYVGVLPLRQHRCSPTGSGGTSIVEAINCSLRHRCGVLVRKSCAFSKSLQMHTTRIKIVIDNHNANVTLNVV